MVVTEGKKDSKIPGSYRTMAAFTAGAIEIAIFHPVDTVAKRLMSNTKNLNRDNAMKIMFKDTAEKSVFNKYQSLMSGGFWACQYKVLQRGYKFGSQPIVREKLGNSGVGKGMRDRFGEKGGKLMIDATAGSLVGIGEVVLLPLDRFKILGQTNPDALKGKGILNIIRQEKFGLWAGIWPTILRNAPGSFCLFGGTAFTKTVFFQVGENSKATTFQNTISSTVGASLSIAVANPTDVVKTRIQNKNFGEKHSSTQIVKAILREEGMTAFFKGLTPKITASAPKVVFAYTITESIVNKMMKARPPATASN